MSTIEGNRAGRPAVRAAMRTTTTSKRPDTTDAVGRAPRSSRRSAALAVAVAAAAAGTCGLAGSATAGAAAPPVVDSSQISSAKLGVTLFALDDVTDNADGTCPILLPEELGYWTGQAAMPATSVGYEVGSYFSDAVDVPVINCGVNPNDYVDTADPALPYALMLEASSVDTSTAGFQAVLDQLPGLTATPVADPALGGEIAAQCGDAQPRVACFGAWHREGLVIDVLIVGPAELTTARVEALLLSLVPNAVANLAGYLDETGAPVPPTVAPVPPTVVSVPPTVAPVPPTVAPVPPTVAPVPPTVAPVPPTTAPAG